MASTLAAQLHPYLSYLLLGQLALFGGAIFVGCILLIRRFMSREAPGEFEDAGGVAQEINEEIKRLRGLRDRLSTKFADEGAEPDTKAGPAVATPAPETLATTAPTDANAAPVAIAPLTDEERSAIRGEVEAKYAEQIKQLEAKLAEAQSVAANAVVAAVPGDAPAAPAESGDAAKFAQEKSDLEAKVAGLEKALAEYQIFEEDFALVRKYKDENEQLRAQLAAGGVAPSSTAGPQMTEADIASLFGDIASETAKAVETQVPAAPAPAPVVAAAPTPEAAPEPETSVGDLPAAAPEPEGESELDKLLAEAQKESDAAEEVKVFKAEARDEDAAIRLKRAEEMAASMETASVATVYQETNPEPAPATEKKVSIEEVEALSEAGDEDVMAEFEKLLGESGNKT